MQHSVPILRSNAPPIAVLNHHMPPELAIHNSSSNGHRDAFDDHHDQGPQSSDSLSWVAPGVHDATASDVRLRRRNWTSSQYVADDSLEVSHMDAADIAAREKELIQRFWSCAGYVKYREGQRKKKDDPKQEWSDEVETAFIQALARWPPMGRNQVKIQNTLHGRNGLISNYILAVTGQRRGRKQISSHIQTLRPKIARDPYLRRYFPEIKSDDPKPKRRGLNRRRADEASRYSKSHVTRRASRVAGRSVRDDQVNSDRMSIGRLQPRILEMFLQHQILSNNGDVRESERLHTYAELNMQQQQPSFRTRNWQSALDELCLNRVVPLETSLRNLNISTCNFIVAEVAITLPQSFYWGKNVELGVALKFSTDDEISRRSVCYRNTFIDDGKVAAGGRDFHEASLRPARADTTDAQLMFGAKFWASVLSSVAGEVNPSDSLRKILIVQELFDNPSGQEDPVLVVLWTFDLACKRKNGQTTWRRLEFSESDNEDVAFAMPDYVEAEHQNLKRLALSPNTDDGTTLSTVSRCSSLTDYNYNPTLAMSSGSWTNPTNHSQPTNYTHSISTDSQQSVPIQPYALANPQLDLLRDPHVGMNNFDSSEFTYTDLHDVPVPSQLYSLPAATANPFDVGSQEWYNAYPQAGMHFGISDQAKDGRETTRHDAMISAPPPEDNGQRRFDPRDVVNEIPAASVAEQDLSSFSTAASFGTHSSL